MSAESLSGEEPEITRLLQAWQAGDQVARDELFARVYPELKKIAQRQLGTAGNATLQATELIHETYLRLTGHQGLVWEGRLQFFALAATVARQVLVDQVRRRAALKRGGAMIRLDGLPEWISQPESKVDLLALDAALKRLQDRDATAARTVELRYFGGLTQGEIAEVLAVSVPTVARRWQMAKAWLRRELSSPP